jgi:dihydrofolate synthase/folylpolyglutamate synthase
MREPWPRDYVPSAWNDPLDEVVTGLMAHYNSGRRRHDLAAVERLAAAVLPARVPRHVVVVGTNGKSSTAHFLARLLRDRGVRTGLYTSPHLRYWNERTQVDLVPVAAADWRRTLLEVHEAACAQAERPGDLRFFDVLTLAAEKAFGELGVDVGVFEAGIGGRLDAVRVLAPQLTLLTSIGRDHEELLGRHARERLRDKVQAAPPGAALIAGALTGALAGELAGAAGARRLALTILPEPPDDHDEDPAPPPYQRANAALAEAGARWLLGEDAGTVEDFGLSGRFERGRLGPVPYVVDVAHNPTAWAAFLDAVPASGHEVVAAITRPRPIGELVGVLAAHRDRVAHLTVTGIRVRPAQDPGAVAALAAAAGLPARAVAQPDEAFASAWRRARREQRPLLVFGSNYLVVDFLAWVAAAGAG